MKMLIGTRECDERHWNTNIFDNHRYGIYGERSDITVYNCTFQKRDGVRSQGLPSHRHIYVQNPAEGRYLLNVINPDPDRVPNNAFFDGEYAISTYNYYQCEISNCDIRSKMDNAAGDGNGFNATTAVFGIHAITDDYSSLTIERNKIYNIMSPITQQVLNATVSGNSSIKFNQIGLFSPDVDKQYYPPHGEVDVAINVSGLTTTDRPNINIACENNNINDAISGIFVTSLSSNSCTVNNNVVNLRETYLYDLLGNAYIDDGYGIKLEGNNSGTTLGHQVIGNAVQGDLATATSPTQDIAAIYVGQTDNVKVGCNDVQQSINGLDFAGSNVPAEVKQNSIPPTNYFGFTLDQVGIIGTQGTSTCTSDNNWQTDNATWAALGYYKTSCTNYSDAAYSPLIVQNTPTYNPDGSGYFATGSNPYMYPLSIGYATPTAICPCLDLEWGGKVAQKSLFGDTTMAEKIALGQISIPSSDSTERLYVMQHQLFRTLVADSNLISKSSIFRTFMRTKSNSNFNLGKQIEEGLNANDTAKIKMLLNGFRPSNSVDNNYKRFYNWMLKNSLNQKALKSPVIDTATIFSLAQLCPFVDGPFVYQARNIYNSLVEKPFIFKNNCSSSSPAPRTSNKIVKIEKRNSFRVFPNPSSSGDFNLLYLEQQNQVRRLEVTDMLGKVLFVLKLNKGDNKAEIKLPTLPGVYTLRTTGLQDGMVELSKLVIQ